jgi:hypothetical protein
MSEIKVDKLSPQSGVALEIGDSGDTITCSGTPVGFGGGKVLQIYILENTSTHTTSTTFANGTTLPTLTDGASLFDAAEFTPTNSSSKILVEAYVVTSGTTGGHATVWMCKDSDSNAVAVSAAKSNTDYTEIQKMTYWEDASDTSGRTFKLRFANNSSGRVTTVNMNHAGSHTWGGLRSYIHITEYAT